jgi:hypothetical protein
MNFKSQLKVIISYSALILLMSGAGCGQIGERGGGPVGVGVGFRLDGPTRDILQQGLNELQRQPNRWRETMVSIIKQLEQSGTTVSKQVAQEVQSTYNSILGQTGSEFSCRADFVAKRLEQRLQSIAHKYDPEGFPAPDLFPVICSTNPSVSIPIDINFISYFGYDFKQFEGINKFQGYLQYEDGTVVRPLGAAQPASNYHLNLDVQSLEVKEAIRGMDRNKKPQIVLKWGEGKIQSVLPVEIPVAETPKPKRDYVPVATIGPFGGPYGDWRDEQRCPTGQWVLGASLIVEPDQGRGDDTALNGIHLICGTLEDKGRVTPISSGTGSWGNKTEERVCANGYVVGANLRIEGPQGSRDDTGAVDAEFRCENGDTLAASYRLGWGRWSDLKSCPSASAICGIKTKVESGLGRGDDTALNDAEFTCCSLP